MNPVVRGDIVVSDFLNSVGGYRHKERRDRLLDILDVDLDWHMHQISDGERRRVQLCMGLMGDWDVLLLDEVRFLGVACKVERTDVKSLCSWAGYCGPGRSRARRPPDVPEGRLGESRCDYSVCVAKSPLSRVYPPDRIFG